MAQCLSMITVTHKGVRNKVPCGKCGFCLKSKRESWMFRIHHEMRTQEYPGYFLTLTYHPKYVKRTEKGLSLRFRDLQLWFKRIRKEGHYLKYIAVGEYGTQTLRPHYHCLLWTSADILRLESLWDLGLIHAGKISMASAMYTLKYIIQPKPNLHDGVLEKPRAQFSRGLGLGYLTTQVYDWHTECYDDPKVFSYIDTNKVALPRYYRSKIFTKYQMKLNAENVKLENAKKERAERKALERKGIMRPRPYIKQLRAENAAAIIKKTKFNQSI